MDEKKLDRLLEDIEIFIDDSTKNTDRLVEEIRSLKNEPKTAQILNEASERHNSVLNQISALVKAEKALIEGFKPEVTVKHLNVDVKKPLAWIVAAIAAILLSFSFCYYYYHQNKTIAKERDTYEEESSMKDWNYMKYKYLELFGEPFIVNYLKEFNKDYNKDWKIYDKKIVKRERQLKEATQASELAKQKKKEALELQQKADSLNNPK